MGLFSPSPPSVPAPSHTNPAPSADGAYIAPDRSARDQCWAARDAFFACLDRNGIVDSVGKEGRAEADRLCGREEGGLRRECKGSWVEYFKLRRVAEFKRKQTIEKLEAEGARPMKEGMGLPSRG